MWIRIVKHLASASLARAHRPLELGVWSFLLALFSCSLATAAAAEKKPKTQTYLFMDWNDVEKGRLVPVYDTNRLTDEAWKSFAQQKKDWNIDTRFGKHGMKRYHLAEGVRIAIEPAKKTAPWIVADQPWETDISGGDVLFDLGKFRCWYSTSIPKVKVGVVYAEEGRAMETNGIATCYAESTDGIHWTKPSLKMFSINGSSENNMVSGIWIDSPFRDDHGAPDERYKAFTFDELPAAELPKNVSSFNKYGLYGMVSPDGYHWTRLPKPLVRHFADTWNIAGWDPLIKKYVAYFRGHTGGRSITRAETDDFHNWPMPQTVFCIGPEELPVEDYYSSGYTTYPGVPSIRLMFPGIYHLNTSKIDGRLAISRDGQGWNWVSRDTIIPIGKPGEWDSGMVFGQPNLLKLPDGRLALPYSGYDHGHEDGFTGSYKDWPKEKSAMAWALWDDSRLAGIEAAKTGEFFAANPLRNVSEIQVNARAASRGRIEAEFVEQDNVLPGFSFADCIPLKGDNVWTPIRWKGKSVADAKGKKIQIHFRLTKAKIFAYRTLE